MNQAYLLIGGNIGDREVFLSKARNGIGTACGPVVKVSSLYETAAWGMEEQSPFLNQALKIETRLSAPELLQCLLQIEEKTGRKRALKYGPRTIDLDILFFNQEIIEEEGLIVPHPQIQNRRFALVPMTEIAADLVHPLLHKTMLQLLTDCPDPLDVHKI